MAKERMKALAKKIGNLAKKSGGKLPAMGKVMEEVGYSKSYSENPKRLKGTETWDELMDIYCPEPKVARKLGGLLDAAEISHYIFPPQPKEKPITDAEIKQIVESVAGCKVIYVKRDKYVGVVAYYQAPDNKNQRETVDMLLKLRDKYAPEKISFVKRKYEHLTNAELAEVIRRAKNFILKKD